MIVRPFYLFIFILFDVCTFLSVNGKAKGKSKNNIHHKGGMYAHIMSIGDSNVLNNGLLKDDKDYSGIHSIHEKLNHLPRTYIGQSLVQTTYTNNLGINPSQPVVNSQPTPQANTLPLPPPPPYSGGDLKQSLPPQGNAPPQQVPVNAEVTVPEADKEKDNKESIACTYFWFLFSYCNSTTNTPGTTQDENSGNVTPIISQNCNPYGTQNISLSDFKETNDNGWIIVNENNVPKITRNKQVISNVPSTLQLKNTLCNAAEIRATIKLSENSSGGLVIRGSEQNMMLVELNVTTKTVSLKLLNGASQELISEQVYDRMSAQFVHYVSIKDTGYKGSISVDIDDNKIINQDRQPSTTSGSIGVFVSSGNATFGDLSVSPISV